MDVLLENNYWGCTEYYASLVNSNECTIERFEYFKKMSFRNRCIIVGSNGLINLSIPIVGGRNMKRIVKDVKISYDEKWYDQHCKAIVSSYAKSPFYEYYGAKVESLIKNRHEYLFDKNIEILSWVNSLLKINKPLAYTESYSFETADNKIDLRDFWLPNSYTDKKQAFLSYSQVFEEKLGFYPNVSILDLIFSEGPNAINVLKKSNL